MHIHEWQRADFLSNIRIMMVGRGPSMHVHDVAGRSDIHYPYHEDA
jgi:hypothetical protein